MLALGALVLFAQSINPTARLALSCHAAPAVRADGDMFGSHSPRMPAVAKAPCLRTSECHTTQLLIGLQALLSKQHELEAALETERQERAAIEEAAARKVRPWYSPSPHDGFQFSFTPV